jgi:hypothetical protein
VRRCSLITHVQYPGSARFCSSPSTMTFQSQAGDFASQPFGWFASVTKRFSWLPCRYCKARKPFLILQKSCQCLAARVGGVGVEKPLEFRLDQGWPGTGRAGIGQIARNRVVTGAEVRQYPEMPASLLGLFGRGSERQKNGNREVGWVGDQLREDFRMCVIFMLCA